MEGLENIGVLLFHIIFILLIPLIFYISDIGYVLKYYMPLIIVISKLLSLTLNKYFENLYNKKNDIVSQVSRNILELFALIGVIWQTLSYSSKKDINLVQNIGYGVVLYLIIFKLSNKGLELLLNLVDNKIDMENKDLIKIVIGLVYIIAIIGIQGGLLTTIDTTNKITNNRITNNINKRISNKLSLGGY